MSGWFAVKRGITEHDMFHGRPERVIIWLWLLDHACWTDTKHDVDGKTITVPAGSVCVSLRRLARECGVPLQTVRGFLDRLKNQHMINTEANTGRTVITLCNWGKYQAANKQANTLATHQATHEQHTKEQDIPIAKAIGRSAPLDPEKLIFDHGVALLCEHGRKESQARAIIGKWKRDHQAERVLHAISSAVRDGATEPVSYIEVILGNAQKKAEQPKDGDTRINPRGEHEVFNAFNGWMVERW